MRAPRLAAFLVAASAFTPLFAAEMATVIGRVSDASGAVVAGATVTARNVDTGISRSAVTETDGTYRLPVLPPGRYELKSPMTVLEVIALAQGFTDFASRDRVVVPPF